MSVIWCDRCGRPDDCPEHPFVHEEATPCTCPLAVCDCPSDAERLSDLGVSWHEDMDR